jgi:hypothetical protein
MHFIYLTFSGEKNIFKEINEEKNHNYIIKPNF